MSGKNNYFKKLRILIVSQDKKALSSLKNLFNKIKYPFSVASSFREASLAIRRRDFKIIFLDLDSLYLEPQKIEEFIRKRKKKEILIFLILSPAFLNLALNLFKSGVDFYLKKPIEVNEIKILIERFISFQNFRQHYLFFKKKAQELTQKTEPLTLIDFLTNCYNYHYLVKRLSEEIKRTERNLSEVSLLWIDIRSFKRINEAYGEVVADRVIVKLSHLLKRNTRINDVVCRVGGEEFAIIFPDSSREYVRSAAERLYKKITDYNFGKKDKPIFIQVDMGIVIYPGEGISSVNDFIKAAEKAIKISQSKKSGGITWYFQGKVSKEDAEDTLSFLKEKLRRLNKTVNQNLIDMIYGFARTIEAKDFYTGLHVEETVAIAEKVARKLKLSPQEIEDIKHAAILHDLGKVGVDERIIRKKSKLTRKEMAQIKRHPLIAAEILKPVAALSGAIPAILHHHERFDGKGYPYGLKKEEIPLSARIIAVADVYQALISNRPYRKAYSKKEAIEIIKKESGTHFDPRVVEAFLKII